MPAAVRMQPAQYLPLPPNKAPHAIYGFAVTPRGFTADFGRRHKVDVGGGVRIRTGPRRAISLGYRFLHISNGFTSPVNPGVDNNVFYAGFSILR